MPREGNKVVQGLKVMTLGIGHIPFFFFLNRRFFVCLFVCFYFWLCWVFIAACGLSLVAASGGYSSLRCMGFSLSWLLLLQN